MPPIFAAPVRIQGYSADNVTTAADVTNSETPMGVDGRLSAGWVPAIIVQNITLQGDSESNDLFENWAAAERADAVRDGADLAADHGHVVGGVADGPAEQPVTGCVFGHS